MLCCFFIYILFVFFYIYFIGVFLYIVFNFCYVRFFYCKRCRKVLQRFNIFSFICNVPSEISNLMDIKMRQKLQPFDQLIIEVYNQPFIQVYNQPLIQQLIQAKVHEKNEQIHVATRFWRGFFIESKMIISLVQREQTE